MRVKILVAIALGIIPWWSGTGLSVAGQVGELLGETLPPHPGASSNSNSPDAFSEQEKAAVIDTYVNAPRKSGYETSVVTQPDGRIIAIKLTKIGKTDNGHGILEKNGMSRTRSI